MTPSIIISSIIFLQERRCLCACMFVCMCIYMCIALHVYIHACCVACVYTYVLRGMYVCLHVCVCICIHTRNATHVHRVISKKVNTFFNTYVFRNFKKSANNIASSNDAHFVALQAQVFMAYTR